MDGTTKTIVINSLAELTSVQLRALLERAEIRATGVVTYPPLDIDAVRARADELDPSSQLKADIYRLIVEVQELRKASTNGG